MIVGVHATEVIPVLMVAAAEHRVIADETAAVVNGRQVVADRTDVCELDILLDHTLTTGSILAQLTARRCKYVKQCRSMARGDMSFSDFVGHA